MGETMPVKGSPFYIGGYGGYGGYGGVSGAYKQDGEFAQGRFAMGFQAGLVLTLHNM